MRPGEGPTVIPAEAGIHGWRLVYPASRIPSIGSGLRGGDERGRRRIRFALLAAILLAACGKQQELQPAGGRALPPRPLMARATPTVDQLLTKPTIADPERVDELLKKSEERREDRFDLPPP